MTRKHVRWGWVFVSPYIFSLLFFTVIPLLVAIFLAFTRYNMITPPRWVGVQNFTNLILEPRTWKYFRTTWVFALMSVSLRISTSCVLAVLLNQKIKSISLFRIIYFLPALTPSTAVTVVWGRLFQPKGGVLNAIFGFIGLGPFAYIYSQNWLAITLTLSLFGVWSGAGYGSVLLIAALQAVSEDVLEAADIDGAGPVRQFFKIKMPLITPTIFYLTMTGVASALQAFETFYLFQPYFGADMTVVNARLYSLMWNQSLVGDAAALGWLSFIFIALITWLQKKYEKKWVHYDA